MGRHCCVPSCKSNYNSTKKLVGYVSAFQFPKDEERKLLWIKAIGRENFIPKKHVVCAKHFEEDDIIRHDPYLQKDGTLSYILLRAPKLKDTAIPKIFPNLPDQSQKKRFQPQSTESLIDLRNEVETATSWTTLDTKVKEEVFFQDCSINICNEQEMGNKKVKTEFAEVFMDNNEIYNCTTFKEENEPFLTTLNEKVQDTESIHTKFYQNIEDVKPEVPIHFKLEEVTSDQMDRIKIEYVEEFSNNNEIYNCTTFGSENEQFLATTNGNEGGSSSIHTEFQQNIEEDEPELLTNYEQKESPIVDMDTEMQDKEVNLETKKHKCQSCDYSASFKSHLRQHVDVVHSKLKPYQCQYCCYCTAKKSDLQIHRNSVHLRLKPYQCEYCSFRGTTNSKLKKHTEIVHLGLKPFKCDKCEYATAWKASLQYHVNSIHVHLKRYQCKFCDHAATCEDDLKLHINVVHFNKKLYKCELCKYSDLQEKNLQTHMNFFHPKE